ncbi:sigma-54 interaction domain-containing protein, partial [Paenibacillus darwinianus]
LRHPLSLSGIGLALTGHTLNREGQGSPRLEELYGCRSAAFPIRASSDPALLGVLGIFIAGGVHESLTHHLEALPKLTAYCAELTCKQNDYLSLHQMLQAVTGQLSKSLFVLKKGRILFHNRQGADLLVRKRDLVHMALSEITDDARDEAMYMIRTEDSDSLFEIKIIKQPDYHYVYFKQLAHRTNGARRDKNKLTTKDLVGSNGSFLQTVSLAKSAAKTNANVLLLGESGTGKELFARAIHNESARKERPFVAINCAAIPKELINAELFGYVEGAFTGAKKGGSPGKFEVADGGTLFLDEIGDMPFELQATLLRVLQEKEVIRVGGHRAIPVDVRIIAATNKNLNEEIAYNSSFRSDLYYRLNVFAIELIPLRERIGDIGALSAYFLHQLSVESGLPPKELSPEALKVLEQYTWHGNIRELNNVMERAFYLSDRSAAIMVAHLPQYIVHSNHNQSAERQPHLANLADASRSLDNIKEIKQRSDDDDREFYIQALS